jgi:hypothetical protein
MVDSAETFRGFFIYDTDSDTICIIDDCVIEVCAGRRAPNEE